MTDSHFPDRWLLDRRMQLIARTDFLAFLCTNTWCMTNRTDGIVTPADLPMMWWMTDGMPSRFVAAGLWVEQSDNWLIDNWLTDQTSVAKLDAAALARSKGTARVQKHRAKDTDETAGQADVTRYATSDVTRDFARTGQNRPGEAVLEPTELETAALSVPELNRCGQCGKATASGLLYADGLMVCRGCRFPDESRSTMNGHATAGVR